MTSLELIGVLGATSTSGAIWLMLHGRRVSAQARLRRRLGLLGAQSNGLVRESAEAGMPVMDRFLAGAGVDWTPARLLGRFAALLAISVLLGAIMGSAMLSVAAGLGGCAALWMLVSKARARRLALCDEQMPQALEIVSLALRAGHALPSALRLAADESPAPLSDELHRVVRENSLGRPLNEVIASFAKRLKGCAAVETFTVAVLVLSETGGNLITVIERIVESARARSNYNAKLRAMTAEGRQSAKLLGALPAIFAGLTISVDPTYLDTLRTSGGFSIAMVAVGMWIAGILWTRRIIRPLT